MSRGASRRRHRPRRISVAPLACGLLLLLLDARVEGAPRAPAPRTPAPQAPAPQAPAPVTPTTVVEAAAARSPATRADSITLGEAYRLALRVSEQVQIAVGNRDLADTLHTGALTLMGPTATVTARGTYDNTAQGVVSPGLPSTGLQGPYSFNMSATLVQPLFRRQIFDARRATALGVESADATLKRVRQQLMFDVATVFINVLSGRQQVTIAQVAVQRAEAEVTSTQKRVRAGAAVVSAELLAEIGLNRALVSLNIAEGALRLQESVFERLTNVAPPAHLLLPPTPMNLAFDEAQRAGFDERADLRALRVATLQARATVRQLQGKIFWPTLDAQLFAGFIVSATAQGFIAGASPVDYRFPTYGVTGNLVVPLFQTGDEWIQVRLQRQRVGIAAFQESLLRRQVADDVRQAITQLTTANKAIEIATRQQKTAQQDYELVSRQYNAGAPGVTFLEVATAQAAVFEADTNLALASFAREQATYQLLFAEGKIDL